MPQVGEWVKSVGEKRGDANFEIVDIADFKLPLLGEVDATERNKLRLVPLNSRAWTDSYLSSRNTTTVFLRH
jgi:hypothetical protein